MKFVIKKKYFAAAFIALLICAVSGCANEINSDKILSDLQSGEYATEMNKLFDGVSQLVGDDDYDMDLEVLDTKKIGKTMICNCKVKSYNSELVVTDMLRIKYIKNGSWELHKYSVTNTKKELKNELSEDIIINAIEDEINAELVEMHIENANITIDNLNQELDEDSIAIKISATAKATSGILTRIYDVTGKIYYTQYDEDVYSSDNKWDSYIDLKCSQPLWDLDSLVGKRWTCEDNSDFFIYIESFDTQSQTIRAGYRVPFHASTIGSSKEEYGKVINMDYELEDNCIVIVDDTKIRIYPDTHAEHGGDYYVMQ